MKKLLSLIAIILILCLGLTFTVSAEPTDSFTHEDKANGTVAAVLSREMYTATGTIKASDLGLERSFDGITLPYVHEVQQGSLGQPAQKVHRQGIPC